MRIKKDQYTLRPHGDIILKALKINRGPLLDRMQVCRAQLFIFGYLTLAENRRISKRIAMQQPTWTRNTRKQ